MSSMEDLMQAALAAPEFRRTEALRVLRGDATQDIPVDHRPEPFVTLREVGRRLGVSACSLWRWGAPGHELGGRRRFRLSEVVRYLESDEFKQRAAELKEERREVESVGSGQLAVGSGQLRTVRAGRTNGTHGTDGGATEE